MPTLSFPFLMAAIFAIFYFVERTFDGSLPGFLTAFLGGKKISKKEAEKIKQIIDDYSEK